jgi:hypothetical protein
MDLLTTKQAAERLKCSPEAVKRRCQAGLIQGAERVGRDWVVPAAALEGIVIKPRRRKGKSEGVE